MHPYKFEINKSEYNLITSQGTFVRNRKVLLSNIVPRSRITRIMTTKSAAIHENPFHRTIDLSIPEEMSLCKKVTKGLQKNKNILEIQKRLSNSSREFTFTVKILVRFF